MNRVHFAAASILGLFVVPFVNLGCAGPESPAVSSSAVLETSGNKSLTWTASSAGKMTVLDENTHKVVYGTTVTTGQSVHVDVDANRISLDGQVVNENSLHRGDEYRILFEPTSHVERTVSSETTTVESVRGR